ncbi:MAG TPA: hypothetical protein VK809_08540 [Bacteroidia bacterium]|jgi:transcriptional regulator of acetoin/glycerol metabolism|nr:hypothetical protein [Bacteroidia bacterium]
MGKNSYNATIKQKIRMLRALNTTKGNVSQAAKLAKMVNSTHYRWLKADGEYAGLAKERGKNA